MKSIAFVLGVVALMFCTTSHAESLRCNGDLAQIGDSKASVIQKRSAITCKSTGV